MVRLISALKWTAVWPVVLGLAVSASAAEKEGPPVDKKVVKSEEQWETCLTPEQYRVLRKKGTEMPFTGKYYNNHEDGIYRCAACGNELFRSDDKFDSGTGWPSYFQPIRPDSVRLQPDGSHWMQRMEVVCGRCGSHLGHLFEDGPPPTGKRFCNNSAALDFTKKKQP